MEDAWLVDRQTVDWESGLDRLGLKGTGLYYSCLSEIAASLCFSL